jgi:hypothetical protein
MPLVLCVYVPLTRAQPGALISRNAWMIPCAAGLPLLNQCVGVRYTLCFILATLDIDNHVKVRHTTGCLAWYLVLKCSDIYALVLISGRRKSSRANIDRKKIHNCISIYMWKNRCVSRLDQFCRLCEHRLWKFYHLQRHEWHHLGTRHWLHFHRKKLRY